MCIDSSNSFMQTGWFLSILLVLSIGIRADSDICTNTHIQDGDSYDCPTFGCNAKVTMTGGYVYNLTTTDRCKIVVSGGRIGDAYARYDSHWTVLGGEFVDLMSYDTSMVSICGGHFHAGIQSEDSSRVEIRAGIIDRWIWALDDSRVNLRGGTISGYMVGVDQSEIHIYGQDLHYDPDMVYPDFPVGQPGGAITGRWHDGTEFRLYLCDVGTERTWNHIRFHHPLYVDCRAIHGTNDGSSWENAYWYLQDALAAALEGDEIRIAQGVYQPDQSAYLEGSIPGDRNASFRLKGGIAIRGGYAGAGSADPDLRNIGAFESILTGDLAGNDIPSGGHGDNAFHVVLGADQGDTILEGLTISGGNADGGDEFGYGGGVRGDRGNLTMEQCRIVDNGGRYGGGVCGSVRLISCVIAGNHAAYDGGGYFLTGDTMLEDCVLEANLAVRNGGGLIISNDSFSTIRSCHFTGNFAGENGGGMHFQFAFNMEITDCTIEDNISIRKGGGVFNGYDAYITYIGCSFAHNSAGDEGGVCNERTDRVNGPHFRRCRFTENHAGDEGGGMYTWGGGIVVSESLFQKNHSDEDGGGLQNDGGSPRIEGCQFLDNIADDKGGGFCNEADQAEESEEPVSNPVLRGCLFVGNNALWGGGIHSDEGGPTLVQCTLSENSAEDTGAISGVHGAVYTLNGCILRGNLLWEIDNDSSMTHVSFSDIQGGWPGDGNIDIDPLFSDAENGDYHLKSQAGRWDPAAKVWIRDAVTSPCIDAGDPDAPIGLEPFPNGGVVNMGVYGGTAQASKSWFGKPICEVIVAGDINGDCRVDLADLAILSGHWLRDGSGPRKTNGEKCHYLAAQLNG